MESLINRLPSFLSGGDIGTYSGEAFGSFPGSEGAGDLLLHFGHPQVAFGLIVGERHGLLKNKAQDAVLLLVKACDQIVHRRFGYAPALFLAALGRRIRVLGFGLGEDARVVLFPPALCLCPGVFQGLQQQGLHACSPLVPLVFAEEVQFAQQVGVAKPVSAIQGEVTAEAVMDECAGVVAEDLHLLNRFAAPVVAGPQVGGLFVAEYVKPFGFSADADACLVGMEHRTVSEIFFQLLPESLQMVETGAPEAADRAGTDRMPVEVEAELRQARLRDQLVIAEIN